MTLEALDLTRCEGLEDLRRATTKAMRCFDSLKQIPNKVKIETLASLSIKKSFESKGRRAHSLLATSMKGLPHYLAQLNALQNFVAVGLMQIEASKDDSKPTIKLKRDLRLIKSEVESIRHEAVSVASQICQSAMSQKLKAAIAKHVKTFPVNETFSLTSKDGSIFTYCSYKDVELNGVHYKRLYIVLYEDGKGGIHKKICKTLVAPDLLKD